MVIQLKLASVTELSGQLLGYATEFLGFSVYAACEEM